MKNLFIISGGVGSEREVSLASGKGVATVLRDEGTPCEEIIVERDKSFIYQGKVMTESEGAAFLQENNALVFNLIHGTYGEDGELIRTFEKEKVAHIGASSAVLGVTMNKYLTETVLREHGLPVTSSFFIKKLEELPQEDDISFPCIIKPNSEGSSVGVVKVANYESLVEELKKSLAIYKDVLVQKYLVGREFSCGVLEMNGKEVALSPTEVILTKGELFDYDAKYSEGGCLEVTPAEVSEELKKKIQLLALTTHKITGCKDISRIDMMMDESGRLVVLEINTVPGMTKTSFVPAQMKVDGFTISEFMKGMLTKYS